MKKISTTSVILLTSIFLVMADNIAFFKNVFQVYPLSSGNIGFLVSLGVILASVIVILVTLFSSKYTLKPMLILFLLVAALLNYFMISYNIIVDDGMIRNALETNINESSDLVTLKMILFLFFLGVLPSLLIYKMNIEYKNLKNELFSKLKVIVLAVIIIIIMLFSFSKFYTSFFREHKPLRFYTNPTYFIYSLGYYISDKYSTPLEFKQIGLDAKIIDTKEKKKLIIVVVGETARADKFSLNGYGRETNPLLAKEDVISFTNTYSCGTSTADSVPCMFSVYTRDEFSYKKVDSTENVLDVLKRTGKVDILWRDNNSDSKNVALRVPYENYKTSAKNTMCEGECRDEGMLVGLQEYIKTNEKNNILILLHQMGNHGPAYYKRYPDAFKKFTPTCDTNQFEDCTMQEINNSYDNAILYTDYFLSKTINLLKQNQNDFETAMIYMSDHGESLGENNIYLHGMPYFIAPEAQKHIPSIVWFGKGDMRDRINFNQLKDKKSNQYSHDNLFHSILGLMEVETKVYDKNKDIFYNTK